jgi:hypothetical protein
VAAACLVVTIEFARFLSVGSGHVGFEPNDAADGRSSPQVSEPSHCSPCGGATINPVKVDPFRALRTERRRRDAERFVVTL